MGDLDESDAHPRQVLMRPEHFTIWLQGYLQGLGNALPTSAQVARIREVLDFVVQRQLSVYVTEHRMIDVVR